MKRIAFAAAMFLSVGILSAQTTQAVAVTDADPMAAINSLRSELVDSFNKGDLDRLLSHLDPDVVVTWQNGEVRAHASARITATFAREVLPFHEQYARSHSWWSPDGTSFCYGAVDNYGNDTIWVVDVARSKVERIATGSLAVWSPH